MKSNKKVRYKGFLSGELVFFIQLVWKTHFHSTSQRFAEQKQDKNPRGIFTQQNCGLLNKNEDKSILCSLGLTSLVRILSLDESQNSIFCLKNHGHFLACRIT